MWHGLFENDQWRRHYLRDVARIVHKDFVPESELDFAARRERRIDTLANLVDEHLDTAALLALLSGARKGALPRMTLGVQ
jgi:adenosylcobyric acid synthase